MLNPDNLDWQKNDGLLPAIVQDADSGQVLMLGYMNRDALARTLAAALPSTHAANSGCGPKAKAPATISTSKASAPTATATLCSFSPLLLVQPATPAHKAASTNSTAQPNPTGYFSPASNNSSPHANTPTPKAPIPPASTPQAANASRKKSAKKASKLPSPPPLAIRKKPSTKPLILPTTSPSYCNTPTFPGQTSSAS